MNSLFILLIIYFLILSCLFNLITMNKTIIINQYNFNYKYAEALVMNLTKEQMISVPGIGFENHPAFTLGHLTTGSAMLAEDMGAPYEVPAGWHELFSRNGPGDPRFPDADHGKYPSKELLLSELNQRHEKVKLLLSELNDEVLAQPIGWRFNIYMPTLLDLIVFMCINHEAMHLGQLAGWRRAMKLPSALAAL